MDNYCRNCGTKLNKDDNYCPNCGIKIDNTIEKEINQDEIKTNENEVNIQEKDKIQTSNNHQLNDNSKLIKYLYQIPSEDKIGLTKFIIYAIFPLTIFVNLYDLISYLDIYMYFAIMIVAIISTVILLAISIYKYHILRKDAFNFAIAYYVLFFGFQLLFTLSLYDYGYELSIGATPLHLIIIILQNKKYQKACMRKNTFYDNRKHLDEIVKMYNPENESSENK